MRRPVTWLVVAGLAVLAFAAAVDGIRGGEDGVSPPAGRIPGVPGWVIRWSRP